MTLEESILTQYAEEIGDLEENPIPESEQFMLKMKYGIVFPQLTNSELFLIEKENGK